MGIMALAALFSAIQIYAFFEPKLRGFGSPWYTRPNGVLAVVLGVLLFAAQILIMDRIVYLIVGIGPLLPQRSHVCLLAGMIFLWTVRLDWIGTGF